MTDVQVPSGTANGDGASPGSRSPTSKNRPLGGVRRPSAVARNPSSSTTSSKADPLLLRCRAILNSKTQPEQVIAALDGLAKLHRQQLPEGEERQELPNGKGKAAVRDGPQHLERFRKDVEKTLVHAQSHATQEYIQGLEGLVDSLNTIDAELDSIRSSCEEAHRKYSLARTSSKHLLSQTGDLQSEQESLAMQSSLSMLFLERFTLTPKEEAKILSKEPNIDEGLYAVMDRLEVIRREARILLEGTIVAASDPVKPSSSKQASGSGAGIRAGVDVMDATARQLDAAYAKLGKWLSLEFRQPVREGLEFSPKLKEAVRRMHKGGRDDLLKPALATLSSVRAAYISSSFQVALTVGGPPPTNLPRPIELHAHEPTRYVGDMLAWVHQALASEREVLSSLFSDQDDEFGGRRIGQRRRGIEGSLDMEASTAASLAQEAKDGTLQLTFAERATREMLDKNLDGCCRPLRTRIAQTLHSQEGCIVTFKLASLIDFYRLTITRTLGSKAALSRSLSDLTKIAYDAFSLTLDKQAAGLGRFNEVPDPTLDIPPPLQGAGATLKELLQVLKTALADDDGGETPPDQQAREDALRQARIIETKLVDPMTSLSERLAALLVSKRPRGKSEQDASWEKAIFLCNCYEHIKGILAPHSHAKQKSDAINGNEEEQVNVLVTALYHSLLRDSKLHDLVGAVDSGEPGRKLSREPKATPEEVSSTLTQFYEFLASSLVLSSPKLAPLSSPSLRASVDQAALSKLAEAYGRVVQAIQAPSSGYEWKETLVQRSEGEVRLLLGVEYGAIDVV